VRLFAVLSRGRVKERARAKERERERDSWLLGTVVLFPFLLLLFVYLRNPPSHTYTHTGGPGGYRSIEPRAPGVAAAPGSWVYYNVEYIKERAPS
jgi:hypothetical protein